MAVEIWMMMAVRFSGLSATVGSLLLGFACVAEAAQAPVIDLPAAVSLLPPQAEAPYQVSREGEQKVRWLDPALFTEISPLTVPDVAVKLPEDQQE
jgi:hypothetical protein